MLVQERIEIDDLLRPTPYLIGDGEDSLARFQRVSEKGEATHERALAAAASIADRATHALGPFEAAVRSELVAESDRMEGIPSSAARLRRLVTVKTELLDADVNGFVEFLRDDPRLQDDLGHYRAYAVADEWAKSDLRPREFELRALHSLIMATQPRAGRYKDSPNEIGGSQHIPVPHWDVRYAMGQLADWFETGTGDAVLDAAVVHAWLTHIHPFDDGNGRMARLLANPSLIQSHHPPLLLRSGADRGQYLDALAASDDGDILPLYDLFVKSLRRIVKTMEHPRYVESKIRSELLNTVPQRWLAWRDLAKTLLTCLEHKTRETPWSVRLMGYPTAEDFEQLERRSTDGNTWFAKFRNRDRGRDEWLAWFGFQTDMMVDLMSRREAWPSILLAERTDDPRSVHPFSTRFEADGRRPGELMLIPGQSKPAVVRWSGEARAMHIDEAAALLVETLCR